MVRAKWEGILLVALSSVGFAWGQQAAVSPPAKDSGKDSVMTLQAPGKPEQNVKILRKWQNKDGTTSYEVQDLKTGEKATITESGASPTDAAPPPRSRFRELTSKILHLGYTPKTPAPSTPPPAGKNPSGSEPPLLKPDIGAASGYSQIKPPADQGPARQVAAKVPAEAAPPTDWHQSWGKADDHKTARTSPEAMPRAAAGPLDHPEGIAAVSGRRRFTR
jgi:hypothetical protein